jgi:hypothetical protein
MVFTLSAGEVIHVGDGVTLTILAIEGDVIRFTLATPAGASPRAGDVGQNSAQSDLKRRRNGWECNEPVLAACPGASRGRLRKPWIGPARQSRRAAPASGRAVAAVAGAGSADLPFSRTGALSRCSVSDTSYPQRRRITPVGRTGTRVIHQPGQGGRRALQQD